MFHSSIMSFFASRLAVRIASRTRNFSSWWSRADLERRLIVVGVATGGVLGGAVSYQIYSDQGWVKRLPVTALGALGSSIIGGAYPFVPFALAGAGVLTAAGYGIDRVLEKKSQETPKA